MQTPRLCSLQFALGRVETCPKEACPFWEPGGAVLEGRCALEGMDLSNEPELAALLLELRLRLQSAKSGEEAAEARRLFHRLVNSGPDEGAD